MLTLNNSILAIAIQQPTTLGRNLMRIVIFVCSLHERTKFVGPYGSIDIQDGQVGIFKGSLNRIQKEYRER
jgi:hypothetical protein